jgi:hypothetical protein
VFGLFFISFITFSWNFTYFSLQTLIFPFFHYLINFNFIIYAYYMLFILHCLIIIFIWPFQFSQLFYKAKRWRKIMKQIQCVVMQCDDITLMHNYVWCKTFTKLLCTTKNDPKHLQISKDTNCKKYFSKGLCLSPKQFIQSPTLYHKPKKNKKKIEEQKTWKNEKGGKTKCKLLTLDNSQLLL